ncbi:integrating conjugative element protein (TIGR03761 family) [Paraburkholderia sp. BL23I1N1]|uniref:PFL_4669 family integrating conjugative element protein n=1 Tax=unclassified Paraburkholderia TaxID=2615204 RepID=UPI000A9D3AE1|nr:MULTISPECIES: TIGR03761 family integrating conjugative element protein [unclassified Paraburkholderia]REE18597.1 integrating conjugative element protein (TIGR03761 family) [Paraburkholderia sp. BL27I4N3]RKE35611.1 integrating conjugative element protein (TIGR03761 family) [Paraburkholderia sp. BL23I1N1]
MDTSSAHHDHVDPAVDAFSRSTSSPFADGYDLDAERAVLAHLIAEDDPDPADPLFGRYQLFLEREDALNHMRETHALRQGSDSLVRPHEAQEISRIGQLGSDGADRMRLHTRDAMRLFLGRSIAPGEQGHPMAGGRRVAASLRALWSLSGNDNPYADWKLIEIAERIAGIRRANELEQQRARQLLDAAREKGLEYSVLQSREPAQVSLGFGSPYGYMIVMLLVELDYLVRLVRSAVLRDLMSSTEGFRRIGSARHRCLSVFHFAVHCQRVLTRAELLPLSRVDFLPNADTAARQRVEAARALLGVLPRDVFTGAREPRHSRRRVSRLSDAELRLLDSVRLSGDDAVAEAAAAALVP